MWPVSWPSSQRGPGSFAARSRGRTDGRSTRCQQPESASSNLSKVNDRSRSLFFLLSAVAVSVGREREMRARARTTNDTHEDKVDGEKVTILSVLLYASGFSKSITESKSRFKLTRV